MFISKWEPVNTKLSSYYDISINATNEPIFCSQTFLIKKGHVVRFKKKVDFFKTLTQLPDTDKIILAGTQLPG